MTRRYDVTNRPRRTSKASGASGWYDNPEWRARSRAWLSANPICVGCPAKATICDPDPPVIAMLCCAGRSCRWAGRATAEFQAVHDQSSLTITPASPTCYLHERPSGPASSTRVNFGSPR